MKIKPGDVYGLRAFRQSLEAIHDAHLILGYADALYPTFDEKRDPDRPMVDVEIGIFQGRVCTRPAK